jgi:predicted nucleic acid-binding protein
VILAGTNILLRSITSLNVLRRSNETLCVAPQNLVEFWAVATRPQSDNGMELTTTQAANELTAIQDFFRLLPHTPDVTEAWKRIVTAQGVMGKQTHDAHLVAIMQVNAVASILTFNVAHFQRFAGITVLEPSRVI